MSVITALFHALQKSALIPLTMTRDNCWGNKAEARASKVEGMLFRARGFTRRFWHAVMRNKQCEIVEGIKSWGQYYCSKLWIPSKFAGCNYWGMEQGCWVVIWVKSIISQCQSISVNCSQSHSISLNLSQCQSISVNFTQSHSMSVNLTQSHSISLNLTQSHSISLNLTRSQSMSEHTLGSSGRTRTPLGRSLTPCLALCIGRTL